MFLPSSLGKVSGFFKYCFINATLVFFLSTTDNFGFKQEDRFDCGTKAGDVFASQRRFPQPLFWDYKVHLLCEGKQY